MAMARDPVAQLWVQSQGALVRVGPAGVTAPSRTDSGSGDDLRAWVDRTPMPWSGMLVGGMATAVIGLVLASMNPLGFLGVVAFSSMISLGGGLAVMGVLKRKRAQERDEPRALPAPSATREVVAERSRRVARVLASGGQATFEDLIGRLRWTEKALIETLVHMKNTGAVEEDLDLDSGQWVYRVQEHDAVGQPAALTLDERQAHHDRVGTEGS
jgi:predicted lipid-binding transport protein (Tim44 family)